MPFLPSACAHFGGSQESEPLKKEISSPPKAFPPSLSQDEFDLEMAKMNAKVSELISEQQALKARLKLIERGLVLGIAPDEISRDLDADLSNNQQKAEKNHKPSYPKLASTPGPDSDLEIEFVEQENSQKTLPQLEKIDPPTHAEVIDSNSNQDSYLKDLAQAQDAFSSGQYGKAVALYEQLASKYQDSVKDGNHLYWIGLSWMNLKEYSSARRFFEELRTKYPSNAWIPRAMVHTAQMDIREGLNDQGVKLLRKVVELYPEEDAGQMARSEINQLEKKL